MERGNGVWSGFLDEHPLGGRVSSPEQGFPVEGQAAPECARDNPCQTTYLNLRCWGGRT